MADRRVGGFLPREHGFWVMLLAPLATSVARHAADPLAWAAGLAVLAAASVAGGLVRHRVRREGAAQIASAALLACSGAPVELAAGAALPALSLLVLAWAAIFVANTLVVRGAFARAARRAARARALDGAAIAVCTTAALGFAFAGASSEALATGLAALVSTALVRTEPSVKQLKQIGLTITALATVAGVLLVL